jgi:uncharacterized protein YndB with AHSA1/START domain
MSSYDWSKFDIFIYIESTPEILFDKWATSAGLESFFMKNVKYESADGEPRASNEHVKKDDRYTWEFIHGSVLNGAIVEVILNQKVSFTFGESIVDVLFIKSKNRTLVHLIQRNIPTDEESKVDTHLNCRGAWIHFLTVLKSVIEFNVDCRDKESLTGGSLATGFTPKEHLS